MEHGSLRTRSSLALALGVLALGCGGRVDDPAAAGHCAKSCTVDADCCPAGVADCPGDYPRNFSCEAGLCRAPRCEKDADCPPFGNACRLVGGLASCVLACGSDADCAAAAPGGTGLGGSRGRCLPSSDDGTRICGSAMPQCQADTDCLATSHCLDGGRCGCRSDADCAGSPYPHCHGGACSCGSDAECGPDLDVCTTDLAFRYPSSAEPVGGEGS